MTGKFISIEGIEGAGKSTQLAFIQQYLEQHDISLVVTREPGGTELAEHIRELLLAPNEQGMHCDTELLLMFAARAEHLQQLVLPALRRGDWVLSDRFVDATFAYQGGGRGIEKSRIQQIADWTLKGVQTDLTLLFDLPVEIGQQRLLQRQQQKDRFEQEKNDFFKRIRECYLQRAQQEAERIKIIDSSQDIKQVQQQIATYLNILLQ